MERHSSAKPTPRGRIVRLALLFGTIYFVQGLSDPTTGIVAQPDQSLLRSWGENPRQIASFVAVLELPWCFKPLFGLLSDFFPLAGSRRRSYLVLTSLVATVGFAGLYWLPLVRGALDHLLLWLLPATVAVVFANVVIDALMIETGQPEGITGQLQSVQWAAVYAGTIVTGILGGLLSEHHLIQLGFLLCAGLMAGTFVLTVFVVPERRSTAPRESWLTVRSALRKAIATKEVLAVGGLMLLWHFNPFCPAVLYFHMTGPAGFSDEFYGQTVSLNAIGSLAACVAYGYYCRRVSPRHLVHWSIVAGVAGTWVYWLQSGKASAVAISMVAGFLYMTASMILVDLAARACPIAAAGTVFALFMAIGNVSTAMTTWLGGQVYHVVNQRCDADAAFAIVIGMGGVLTATSWLAVRFLPDRLFAIPGSRWEERLVQRTTRGRTKRGRGEEGTGG
ncbi:MAG TPA: MFS transporter [Pirellulales bacterium]|nr:MFS transporter [Pirellulales bacterium]